MLGYRLVNFDFRPGENEQIEAEIKIPREPRSVIHGVVKDDRDRIIKDAAVKLFELPNLSKPYELIPLTYTFTDECGQFLFGPLSPNKNYIIKVWVNNVKIRQLMIGPDGKQKLYKNDDCAEQEE